MGECKYVYLFSTITVSILKTKIKFIKVKHYLQIISLKYISLPTILLKVLKILEVSYYSFYKLGNKVKIGVQLY